MLHKPILLIGAARSGTTLLGSLLSEHPQLAFWIEPNHIWRHRHAFRRDDVLTATDATAPIVRYIHREFEHYRESLGRERFGEKTPANCLRIPFVLKVFPDARIVHVVRDGRAAAVSASLQWKHGLNVTAFSDEGNNTSFGQDIAGFTERLRDLHFSIKRFLNDTNRFRGGPAAWLEAPGALPGLLRTAGRKMTSREFLWGPKIPGLPAIAKRYSLLETCAIQWSYCVRSARTALAQAGCAVLEVRYEDFVLEPGATVENILRHAGLPADPNVVAAAVSRVRAGDGPDWREYVSEQEAELLRRLLAPELEWLGYV